jgi:hypothetical protein
MSEKGLFVTEVVIFIELFPYTNNMGLTNGY